MREGACNVLLSSAGRRGALLQIVRASLDATGLKGVVVAADMSPLSAAALMADERLLVPPCRDDAFVPALLEACERFDIKLVIPTIDTELPMLAGARDMFAAVGARVLVPGPETVAIAADKVRTHEWLSREGFPTVRQAEVDSALADSTWTYPVIAKPRYGSASVGLATANTRDELSRIAEPGLLVQSIAAGAEHTVDVWVDAAGRARCAVPRRRIEVRSGEVSKGVTVRLPPLEMVCLAIADALPDASGPLTIQVFVDDDVMTVIEINARLGGGYPLADEAGATYVQWAIEEVAGLPSTVTTSWRDGRVMLRYDAAAFADAADVGL